MPRMTFKALHQMTCREMQAAARHVGLADASSALLELIEGPTSRETRAELLQQLERARVIGITTDGTNWSIRRV